MVGILYRPPDKNDFVNCIYKMFSKYNTPGAQECYLLKDISK